MEPTFTSVEGGFRIELPPAKPSQADPSDTQHRMKRFKWLVLNQAQYEVDYMDSDNDFEDAQAQDFFDKLRDAVAAKGPGQLELDRDLSLSGHPGREIRIRDDGGLNIQRWYVVGKRLYTVAAFVPRKLDCAIDGVVKVLDSFKLVGEKSSA